MVSSFIRSASFLQAARRIKNRINAGTCGDTLQERIKINKLSQRHKFLFYTAVDLFSKNELHTLMTFITICYGVDLIEDFDTRLKAANVLIRVKRYIINSSPYVESAANPVVA